MTEDEMINVLLHPVLRGPFEAWLAERGLRLAQVPVGADGLATYAVTPVLPNSVSAGHEPLDVHAIDGFRFVRCTCGSNPVPHVWLDEHWSGDKREGHLALKAVIDRQRQEKAR